MTPPAAGQIWCPTRTAGKPKLVVRVTGGGRVHAAMHREGGPTFTPHEFPPGKWAAWVERTGAVTREAGA